MGGTVVRIISEAGIPITFVTDANFEPTLTNIRTLANAKGATSSTVLAGLLRVSSTHPITTRRDVLLPRVIFCARGRILEYTIGEYEDLLTEELPVRQV